MIAGLKVVADVVAYRLRKLEMANLAAAFSIAVALRLPWAEVAYRTLFAFVLNVLIYLNNDYIDVALDLRSDGKDAQKSRFLADHLRAALAAQWVLLALLVIAALARDPGLLWVLAAGGGICVAYSALFKARPYVDVLAMMAWGVAMPMCGSPIGSTLGVCMALQLGLFSGVFETIQVLRDHDDDAAHGVRTTSVVLGKERTHALVRILMVLASAYALVVMVPASAAIGAGALLVPFDAGHVERYWTRIKLVYGVAWLVLCAWVLLNGHSGGIFWSIDRAASHG
jgi:4-hydroxybenzoate polyprenyltransferase